MKCPRDAGKEAFQVFLPGIRGYVICNFATCQSTLLMRKYVLLLVSIFGSSAFLAQSTETFETETAASTSFTDNGQVFNITSQAGGPFDIQAGFPGTGWNGTAADNRYIDNDGFAATGFTVGFTISSAGAVPFKLNSMYLFFSNAASLNQNVAGSLTLEGKRGGVTQYTATASSGFVTSTATNNGFTFINMSTFGGSNNSSTLIDQIVITTGGQFEYVALDAFNWSTSSVFSAAISQTNSACYGGTGFASVSASGGTPGYTYSWTPSGGTGSTSTALPAGNYTCTIKDATMATLTKTFTITQPAPLIVGAMASPASALICQGASVSLSGTGASTYTWTGGVVNGVAFNPTTTATYTVTGANASGCTNTAAITVTVNALPAIAAISSSSVICSGSSATLTATGASSYTWSTGGNAAGITVSPAVTTTYTVAGTNANGCSATAALTQSVSLCTGLGKQPLSSAVLTAVYPNPNQGLFSIEIPASSDVSISNALGQILFNRILDAGTHELDLLEQAAGIYTVKIISGNRQEVFKLIKN